MKKLMLMLIAVFSLFGLTFVGHAQGDIPPYGDQRINQNYHIGGHVIYCVNNDGESYNGSFSEGEIRVQYWSEGQDENLGTVFRVDKAAVAAGDINGASPSLVKQQDGFAFYRLPNGRFQLNGPGDEGMFSFVWTQCYRNFLDYVPPAPSEADSDSELPEGCFEILGDIVCSSPD